MLEIYLKYACSVSKTQIRPKFNPIRRTAALNFRAYFTKALQMDDWK